MSVALVARALGASNGKRKHSFVTVGALGVGTSLPAPAAAPDPAVAPALEAAPSPDALDCEAVTRIQSVARAYLVRKRLKRYQRRLQTGGEGGEAAGTSAKKDLVAWMMFDRYDKTGDGRIGRRELVAMCAALGRKLSDEEVAQAMAHLDTDQSGEIGFEEWYTWWQTGLDQKALLDPEEARARAASMRRASITVSHAVQEDSAARHQQQLLAEREEQHETDTKETKDGPGRQTRHASFTPQAQSPSAMQHPMPGAQLIGRGHMSSRALATSTTISGASSSAPEGGPLAEVTDMDLDC